MTRAEEEGCGGRCCLAILFYKHSPNQRKEKKKKKKVIAKVPALWAFLAMMKKIT